MSHDIGNASFRLPAKADATARRFGQQQVSDVAVGISLLVGDFEQSITNGEGLSVSTLRLGADRGIQEAPAQRQGRRRALLHETKELAVEGSRVTVVEAHPLSGVAAEIVVGTEGATRRLGLQFVGERVVVSLIAVVKEAANRAQEFHGTAGEFIFVDRTDAGVAPVSGELPHPKRGVKIAQAAWSVLNIGFKVENGVSVACQTIARQALKFSHQKRT